MQRGIAQFSPEELARVLSHYEIGVIHHIKHLSAGSKRTAKVVVISEQGKFLLKRRPRGKDDLSQVTFAHAVQNYLTKDSFPVTCLVPIRNENNTLLQLDRHIYELFKFVSGVRYDGSAEATVDAGRLLALFHRNLANFDFTWKPQNGSFHNSSMVRRHLKVVGTDKMAGSTNELQVIVESLMNFYNQSCSCINDLGFDRWDRQVVHGDWHPGNMLFSEGKVIAVLDFDAVKIAPPVTDLANGMLQFSIVGGRPNPADWPDYFDQDKLMQFLSGYQNVIKLEKDKLLSLLDLMIETMIAEAVLPVAATGFFGFTSGPDFLKMIQRKANWLSGNRKRIIEEICK